MWQDSSAGASTSGNLSRDGYGTTQFGTPSENCMKSCTSYVLVLLLSGSLTNQKSESKFAHRNSETKMFHKSSFGKASCADMFMVKDLARAGFSNPRRSFRRPPDAPKQQNKDPTKIRKSDSQCVNEPPKLSVSRNHGLLDQPDTFNVELWQKYAAKTARQTYSWSMARGGAGHGGFQSQKGSSVSCWCLKLWGYVFQVGVCVLSLFVVFHFWCLQRMLILGI
jgi:hypothetical protein